MNTPPTSPHPLTVHTSPSKWFALIDDTPLAVPHPLVRVSVLKTQAGTEASRRLVRDHNSPDDTALNDDQTIDLRQGNVFYTLGGDEVLEEGDACGAPAKFAMLVDDRAEIVGTSHQNGRSVRELFEVPADARLFRDLESPHDTPIVADEAVEFHDGPVFYTRRHQTAALVITVNKKRFTAADGVKEHMTGLEIAALVSPQPAATDVYRREGANRQPVGPQETIPITTGAEFDVIRRQVQGGFLPERVSREVGVLRAGGARVTFEPTLAPAAVIYHDVPVRPGNASGLATTDVLVLLPSGYPALPLDGAFLPQGSPLLNRVPGSPQHSIQAHGRAWTLVSYHPHQGGGGPAWNKDQHGVHTYFDELLAWLDKAA